MQEHVVWYLFIYLLYDCVFVLFLFFLYLIFKLVSVNRCLFCILRLDTIWVIVLFRSCYVVHWCSWRLELDPWCCWQSSSWRVVCLAGIVWAYSALSLALPLITMLKVERTNLWLSEQYKNDRRVSWCACDRRESGKNVCRSFTTYTQWRHEKLCS